MANPILRFLRGSNLEIFKFGLYLSFPIGWMYYFGTNLDSRFNIPDFWPTQKQSHTIPREKDELKREVERIREDIRRRKMALQEKGETETETEVKMEGGEKG